jgi:2-iminobutanoate/2-iminopropanoate deaminase
MKKRKNFNTDKIKRTNLVFPQAVITDQFIFVSGTPGVDPLTGRVISDQFEDQAIQAFKNIKTILKEAGSSMEKVVKTTLFMVSGCDPDLKIINRVYGDFFPDNAPARSGPQVMPFPGGILISVECIALI